MHNGISNAVRAVHQGFQPSATEVEDLITRAREHTLGVDFLKAGTLDAVSATFGVHAFIVDAARDRLAQATSAAACDVQVGVQHAASQR
jgi:hypothetical protein